MRWIYFSHVCPLTRFYNRHELCGYCMVIVWLLCGANGYFTGLSCNPQPVRVATYGIYAYENF